MYGRRGRVGSIAAIPRDIFSYEFYKIVPAGLTIMQATLSIHVMTAQERAVGCEATEKTARAREIKEPIRQYGQLLVDNSS